jgi:hypothetical protein
MDQWDLALLDAAEGRAILWKLAVRTPVGMGTLCQIGLYYALVCEMGAANDVQA